MEIDPDELDEDPPGRIIRPSRPFPSNEELQAAGWIRVSRRERLITSTPRVGQYFWVDFPHDAYAPEFVDEHPGIVVRAARRLHDTCIIVPITSTPQEDAIHKHKLAKNPNPKGEKDGVVVWAVCDHLYTVNLNRLRPIKDRYGRAIYPRADAQDLKAIFAAIRGALQHVFEPAPLLAGLSVPSVSPQPTSPPRQPGPNTLVLPKKP